MSDNRLIRKTSVSKFYRAWVNMKSRCGNKNTKDFNRYGGRGICVCDNWKEFDGFISDMLEKYYDNLTLDRIDNNGNYCKENCRWVTRTIQANNTRNVEKAQRFLFNGEILTIKEWAERFGIKRSTLYMRLNKYNFSINDALIKSSN